MAWTEDGNEIATQVFKFVAEVDDALHFWIQCYWVGPDAPLAMPKTLPSLLDLDCLGLAGITPAVLTKLTEADCDELLDHTLLKQYLQPHVMHLVSQIQLGEKVACEALQEHLVKAVRSVASDPEFIKLDEDGQSDMLHEWLEGYLDQAILVCRTEPNGSLATRCTLWPEFVSEVSVVNSPMEFPDTMQERITTLLFSAGVGIKPAPGHVRLYHKSTTNRTSRFLKYGLSHDLLTKRGDFNTAKAPGFYLFSSGSDALWHETTRSQDRMPSVQVQDTVFVFDVPRAQLEDWPHLTPAHRQEWQEWIIGCRTYLNDSALRKLKLQPWRDGPHALETLDQVKNYLRRKVGALHEAHFIAGPLARAEKRNVDNVKPFQADCERDDWVQSQLAEELHNCKMQYCFLNREEFQGEQDSRPDALDMLCRCLVATVRLELSQISMM